MGRFVDPNTVDPNTPEQITDRSKDVIKSGGEWISSIEIENVAVGHPKVHGSLARPSMRMQWPTEPPRSDDEY